MLLATMIFTSFPMLLEKVGLMVEEERGLVERDSSILALKGAKS